MTHPIYLALADSIESNHLEVEAYLQILEVRNYWGKAFVYLNDDQLEVYLPISLSKSDPSRPLSSRPLFGRHVRRHDAFATTHRKLYTSKAIHTIRRYDPPRSLSAAFKDANMLRYYIGISVSLGDPDAAETIKKYLTRELSLFRWLRSWLPIKMAKAVLEIYI